MQGKIYKGIGSFYTVISQGREYICKARGRFRKDRITPVVGDMVEFTVEQTGHSFITDILPRKNLLIRPAAANIDKLIIVMSASVPHPDLLLTDKLTLTCEKLGITPVLVINKCDTDDGTAEMIEKEYAQTGYHIFRTSANDKTGINALRDEMLGYVSCFAGQSAVGKSSILNALNPQLSLETGDLSRKTERGRHTTRHAQLWETDGGGAVLDTPGFSLLEHIISDPAELCKLYPEMRSVTSECRFTGCVHIKEPDCAVKAHVSEGMMSEGRYDRYIILYNEASELYKHRYD